MKKIFIIALLVISAGAQASTWIETDENGDTRTCWMVSGIKFCR